MCIRDSPTDQHPARRSRRPYGSRRIPNVQVVLSRWNTEHSILAAIICGGSTHSLIDPPLNVVCSAKELNRNSERRLSVFVDDSATHRSRRRQLERHVLHILVGRKNKRRPLPIEGTLPILEANETVGHYRKVKGSPSKVSEYELSFAVGVHRRNLW